jgi:CDGSH-type Zn-finger protein
MSFPQQGRRIQVVERGPYRVSGGVHLIRRRIVKSMEGEPLEWDPVGAAEETIAAPDSYVLCRCGHSAHMPFCDGSHHRAGFVGEISADHRPGAERREAFRGPGVTLTDDVVLCSEAGFCRTCLTDVWEMVPRAGDAEVLARLVRMVQHCPSGRLELSLDSGPSMEPGLESSIAVVPDGPLWVRGGIQVMDPAGAPYEVRNRVTLCRCGRSTHMPFCDGCHEEHGFRAP